MKQLDSGSGAHSEMTLRGALFPSVGGKQADNPTFRQASSLTEPASERPTNQLSGFRLPTLKPPRYGIRSTPRISFVHRRVR